tara:strand:+ start:977 stop:1234 length:258 start_codon:yes stop_codon:yes gene_type:complete
MKQETVEAFIKPELQVGCVVSSTESGKCGVITGLQATDEGVQFSGVRFDGRQFVCNASQVIRQADTINEFLTGQKNLKDGMGGTG